MWLALNVMTIGIVYLSPCITCQSQHSARIVPNLDSLPVRSEARLANTFYILGTAYGKLP
jgi:hypothetical protein